MIERNSLRPRSSERGFVVVAALWIIVALAALATIFSTYLSSSARAVALADNALQREALVSASQELTAFQLLRADDETRPTLGAFQFRMNDADVAVSFKSEAARIDLNFASPEMLTGLFMGLGASQAVGDGAAQSIVAWRERASAKRDGNAAVQPNGSDTASPQNGTASLDKNETRSLFAHVNELALVEGIPPALIERALPFVTVFNGSKGIDARIAAPQVLVGLPGMTPTGLKDFLDQRSSSSNSAAGRRDTAPGGNDLLTAKSKAYRVETIIRFSNGRRTQSESVIIIGGKDEPFRVLSWQDDVPLRANASKLARS